VVAIFGVAEIGASDDKIVGVMVGSNGKVRGVSEGETLGTSVERTVGHEDRLVVGSIVGLLTGI
jgi:hypothetical protein